MQPEHVRANANARAGVWPRRLTGRGQQHWDAGDLGQVPSRLQVGAVVHVSDSRARGNQTGGLCEGKGANLAGDQLLVSAAALEASVVPSEVTRLVALRGR